MSVEEPIGPLINLRSSVLEVPPLAHPTTSVLPDDCHCKSMHLPG